MHRYDYKWTLADAKFSKDKGSVFSCFACGGGSTMGYKLAGFDALALFDSPTFLSHDEVCKASSFPLDYDFMGQKPCYICGMSVPPVMMANVATEIYNQWLVNL